MQRLPLSSVGDARTLVTNDLFTEPVPDSDRFADEINAFQQADMGQMPPENAVLFIGSSSIRLWDTLSQDFAEIPVINRGFGGSFIEESTLHADRIAIPYAPKIIILGAGTNDIAEGKSAPQVLHDFQGFVAKIRPALPNTRIVYISVNPTVDRWNHEGTILETNYLIERHIFENNASTDC